MQPIAALCPSCGARLSETSILALAPVCSYCGAVITATGGTLGMTSAFGVSDPSIAKARCAADKAVLTDHLRKYEDMKCACVDQLTWGQERYARLPAPPTLITLQTAPPFWPAILSGIGAAIVWVFVVFLIGGVVALMPGASDPVVLFFSVFAMLVGTVIMIGKVPLRYWRVMKANGNAPHENRRRQSEHEKAVAAAIVEAGARKSSQDHRLRQQIRELEGLIRTVAEKRQSVASLLDSL